MTRRWWRRNAVPLVVLALLVPASWWAFDTVEFGAARNDARSVPAGAEAEIGDWTFAPPTATSVDPDEVGAPTGSDPVVVRIRVTPGDDEAICTPPRLIDPATGREWAMSYALDWTAADDELTFCANDSAGPFDLASLVLLPADAPDRLVVEFTGGLGSDAVLTDVRFEIVR